jgi:hypothetical protein
LASIGNLGAFSGQIWARDTTRSGAPYTAATIRYLLIGR